MRVIPDKLHNNGVNKNGGKHPSMIIIVDQSATSSIDNKTTNWRIKEWFYFFYRSVSMGISVWNPRSILSPQKCLYSQCSIRMMFTFCAHQRRPFGYYPKSERMNRKRRKSGKFLFACVLQCKIFIAFLFKVVRAL